MSSSEPKKRPSWLQVVLIGRNPRVTLVRLVITVILVWLASRYLLLPVGVHGISMEPTYRDGQAGLANRISVWLRPPERGDVLAIRMSGTHVMLLKRIIGLPGERLRIVRNQVLINGAPLDEPYAKKAPPDVPAWNISEIQLSNDEYYAIGDNRSMPQGLHEFGHFNKDHIVGRFSPMRRLFK
jgi:signal peptidase I